MKEKAGSILTQLRIQGTTLGGLVAVAWLIQGINWMTSRSLVRYGITPRNVDGLWGILFAPFLHGNWAHLSANTVPFLILGWLVMLYGVRDFWITTVISALVAGLGTWLISPPFTVSVGASGVIFGYLGFLLLRGFFERSLVSILVSLGVGVLYGGMVFGVLPSTPGVSWQGHLFGFIGGIMAAGVLAARKKGSQITMIQHRP